MLCPLLPSKLTKILSEDSLRRDKRVHLHSGGIIQLFVSPLVHAPQLLCQASYPHNSRTLTPWRRYALDLTCLKVSVLVLHYDLPSKKEMLQTRIIGTILLCIWSIVVFFSVCVVNTSMCQTPSMLVSQYRLVQAYRLKKYSVSNAHAVFQRS